MLNGRWTHGLSMWNWVRDAKVLRDGPSWGLLCDYEPSDGTFWSTRGERRRCEDFTAAPCWGPGVCASGENKQKNAHRHCLLVGQIFVLILVPVSCTNSRRKGGSYMELKWLYSFKSLVWFYPWIYFVYSCQADRRDIYRLPSGCKMLSKKFKNYVNWSGNFYNPVRGTDKFRYIFRWTLDLLLPSCTVLYCTLYEAGVYIISSFFLSLSQRQTYIWYILMSLIS